MIHRIESPSRATGILQRRLFLKAIALGLSAPVAYKLVRSATAQSTGAPQRFLLYYVPHGVPPEHFNPVGEGTDFALDQSGVSILGPLQPYKQLTNLYEGFKYPNADTHEAIIKFLSGADLANDDLSTSRITIEQFIGNQLGSSTLSLGAVPHRTFGLDKDGMLMWDGAAITPQKNPLLAYDEVFGDLGSLSEDTGDSVNDELYQSLLGLTESQIANLKAEVTGLSSEETKLQTHLESIQSLKANAGTESTACDTAPVLDAVESLRAATAGQEDGWFLQDENFPTILAAHLDIAAASMLCNARPVVAIQSMYANAEIDFEFMGSAGTHHSTLSHTGPQISNGTAEMTVREPFANAQRWFIEQLVERVISKLDVDDPADPGRTVLDNTTILIVSEIGEGQWHPTFTREVMTGPPPGMMSYMPIITVGGAGGGLVTGQRLNYFTGGDDGSGDRPAGDVWLTIAKAMGIDATSFGDSSSAVAEALA